MPKRKRDLAWEGSLSIVTTPDVRALDLPRFSRAVRHGVLCYRPQWHTVAANPMTGDGHSSNPNPTRIGELGLICLEGRPWGSTASLDIDPTDGHVWGYGALRIVLGGWARGPLLDNKHVDPILKFQRSTGKILANFGAGTFVTSHEHLRR